MLCTLTSFQTSGRMEQLPSAVYTSSLPPPPLSSSLHSLSLFLLTFPPVFSPSSSSSSTISHCLLYFVSCSSALKNTVVELFSPRRPLKPKRRGKRKPKPQVGGEGGRRMKEKDGGREEKRRRGEEKEERWKRRGGGGGNVWVQTHLTAVSLSLATECPCGEC